MVLTDFKKSDTMNKPEENNIYDFPEKGRIFSTSGINSLSPEEQKKIEEIKPILKNLITHIIEQEINDYLTTLYDKN